MESTWENRDLPVLEAAVALLDEADAVQVTVTNIAAHTGMDSADVIRALGALDGPYVDFRGLPLAEGGRGHWHVERVTPAARQAVGQWPTADSLIARLIDAFNDAAEREPDPERKGRLHAIAGGLGGSVRDVAVDILARIIERQTGLG